MPPRSGAAAGPASRSLRKCGSLDFGNLPLPPRDGLLKNVSAIFSGKPAICNRAEQIVIQGVNLVARENIDGSGEEASLVLLEDAVSFLLNELPKDRIAGLVGLPCGVGGRYRPLQGIILFGIDLLKYMTHGACQTDPGNLKNTERVGPWLILE